MNGIRTNAAAVMLGVSPNTLRSWERRYGFPKPHRSSGGHRQYSVAEIESLRLTLAETHNVSSAISLARERGEGPSTPARLTAAFTNFDEDGADRLLEESLGLRSVDRTIEEVLLEALASLEAPVSPEGLVSLGGPASSTVEFEFGWRYAAGWLSVQRRLTPPPTRTDAILIFDASAPCDLDMIATQALEVLLRRAGLRTLTLTPTVELRRLGRAVRTLDPTAVVLTGRRASLDAIGRVVYGVRSIVHQMVMFDYRGAVPDTSASTVFRLGDSPIAARDALLPRLDPGGQRSEPRPPMKLAQAAAAPPGASQAGV
jgi:MerR family transcriptional regulator, light-induced transcriptional regulator